MFGRAILSSCALIIIFSAGIYYFHIRMTPKDLLSYQKLKAESQELRSRKAFEEKPAVQVRQKVQKDLWFPENGKRTHFRVGSEQSELAIAQKKEKMEAAEMLKRIDCSLDEQLGFLAEQAKIDESALSFEGNIRLNHPLGTLFAERMKIEPSDQKKVYAVQLEQQVHIACTEEKTPFSISAHKAFCECSPPFSLAECQELRFENEVEIRIEDAKETPIAKGGLALYQNHAAILYPSPTTSCQLLRGGDRIDAQEIRFDFLSETISGKEPFGILKSLGEPEPVQFSSRHFEWRRNEGTIALEKEVRLFQNGLNHLESDQGTIFFTQEGKPIRLLLQGNVRFCTFRIKEKESHAIADRLSYDLETKSILLSSNPSKKVLFWQEGLSLSADQIKISDWSQGNIEGIGDVRFSFNLEEENLIQELMSKYTKF